MLGASDPVANWEHRQSGRRSVELRSIAVCRSGDKGDISNIAVVARSARYYPALVEQLTVERLRTVFAPLVQGDVIRYLVPGIYGMNFVMDKALGGGVTRSIALDAHGKSRGGLVGGILIDINEDDL